jgi:oligosaccharide repeat unit polymerase
LIESLPAFLIIWASLLFSFLAVILFLPKLNQERQRREVFLNDAALKRVIYLNVCLAVIDYAVTVYLVGGVAQFLVSHWYLRADDMSTHLGLGYVLYSWFSQANQIVLTAAAVLFTYSQARKGTFNWRFSFFLLVVFLFHVIFTGNRIFVALYIISLVVSCWLYSRKTVVIALMTAAPALALVFSAWSYFRSAPTKIAERTSVYMDADLGNRTATILMDAFDGSDAVLLFHIIDDFGVRYSYMYGGTYLRSVSFIIPRSIYPDKAPNFAVQLAEKYEPGGTTSLCATELGELYANFGPLSVLLLPLITLLILITSEARIDLIRNQPLASAVAFILIIWMVRSTFEDNLITFLVSLFVVRIFHLQRGLTGPLPNT